MLYYIIPCIILFIILSFLSYRINKNKQSKLPSWVKILAKWYILPVLFFIISMILGYFLFNKQNSSKSIAQKILKETDQTKYDQECDILFKKKPELYEQYSEMKKTRDIKESRNLCGNYAKNILGRKI